MGLHILKWWQPASNQKVCVWGGGLFKTKWIVAFVFKYERVDRRVGLTPPAPCLPPPFSERHAQNFSFFPPFHILTFFHLSSSSRPLFSPPLPPPRSYPVRPIKYRMIAEREKMRGVRWREGTVDALRSTPGRDKEEEWHIELTKENWKGGGGSKKCARIIGSEGSEDKYIPPVIVQLSCTDLYYEKYYEKYTITHTPQPTTHIYTGIHVYHIIVW